MGYSFYISYMVDFAVGGKNWRENIYIGHLVVDCGHSLLIVKLKMMNELKRLRFVVSRVK